MLVEIAGRTGCGMSNILVGPRRTSSRVDEMDFVSRTPQQVSRKLNSVGARVLIEGLSSIPVGRPIARTPGEAAELVRDVQGGGGDAAMLLDFFQLVSSGCHLETEMEECRDLFGHVQIADAPHRMSPGTGHPQQP